MSGEAALEALPEEPADVEVEVPEPEPVAEPEWLPLPEPEPEPLTVKEAVVTLSSEATEEEVLLCEEKDDVRHTLQTRNV